MKILWFYMYAKDYNFDSHFHLDYIRWMKNNGYQTYVYGPHVHEAYSDICLTPYNENITMNELYKLFSFDAVICMTKSRCFFYYRPEKYPYNKEERRGEWLPKGFKDWKGKKVLLDEDKHYDPNYSWEEECNFNLVLQRHYSSYERFKDSQILTKWLPFSVDIDTFKPNPNITRINKICFMGNSTHEIYVYRRGAVDLLKKKYPLIMEDLGTSCKGQPYINNLQKYIASISCSSIYNISPAKMWEIRASGSLLLTDEGDDYGLELLFPKDTYVTYKRDFSDLFNKVGKILDKHEWVKEITNKALTDMKENHSNKVRTQQLIELIEKI